MMNLSSAEERAIHLAHFTSAANIHEER